MWNWLSRLFGSEAEEPAAAYLRSSAAAVLPKAKVREVSRRVQAQKKKSGIPQAADAKEFLALLESAGLSIPDAAVQKLYMALRHGRKIEAVKLLRAASNGRLGLKEAKHLLNVLMPACR